MAQTMYVIDGHAQIYRAYYAPFRDLTSAGGEPTRATYVFFSMLFNLIRERHPDYLVVAIDSADSADGRRKVSPEYKANREPTPDDLLPQIDRIVSTLQALSIPTLSVPGFEADDVMATLSARWADHDLDVYLVSRDKDLEQLITGRVRLYDPLKNEVIDAAALEAAKGYRPEQAIEVQTLTGDPVDNIPGIAGVGLKTAARLVQQYGTAEAVLAHAGELTPKLQARVRAFAEQLPTTRTLVTLRRDLDCPLDLRAARFAGLPLATLRPIFEHLGFTRLLQQLEGRDAAIPAAVADGGAVPAVPRVPRAYQLVNTPAALDELAARLRGLERFAFDTETTGLNPVDARLVGIAVAWAAGQAAYIPVRGVGDDTLDPEQVVQALRPAFEDPRISKCGHNIKFDLIVLEQAGLVTHGPLFDSMIASFLIDPLRRSHGLDWLVRELYDEPTIPIVDLIGKGRTQVTIDEVDIRRVCEYAAEDADYTLRLYHTLLSQLQPAGLAALFHETEMPLVEVLARMEQNGVALDVAFLERMGVTLTRRCRDLTEQIYASAGRRFNIDSTRQLAEVLFDDLQLPVVRKTKTGRSTDAESLAALCALTNNPLPRQLLEYRELTKLQSTYVDSLPRMVSRKSGRIHASFNMTGAVTGRLSSNDPNLQNIPIRTDVGREIRKAFVAAGAGQVLLTADYSQIELRLLAHFARDRVLIRAFEQDQDIHCLVASQVFDVSLDQVTAAQRSQAKAVNFGIIYGQSAFGLSRGTGMTVADAKQFIDRYFERYPEVRQFIDRCIAQAERDGYATTVLGRRRPIPELRSRNRPRRMLGARLAVNTVLQGSAADLIKRAMVSIHAHLGACDPAPRMLIQVHDELVFELPEAEAESFAEVVRHLMCTAIPLDVPLKVDIRWGRSWYEGK